MMKTNNPKKNRIWLILFILFLLVMITAAGILIASQIKSNKEKDMYEELLGEVNDIDTEDSEEMTETEETDILAERGIDIPEKYLDWDALHEENFKVVEVMFRPTAENFAKFFYEEMTGKGYKVIKATVYETPKNCASYVPGQFA